MNPKKTIIIVNGIGLSGGGKLILDQFCCEVEKLDNFEVILFVNFNWKTYSNIQIVREIHSDFISRLKFNNSGLQDWITNNSISPSCFISFNNLGVNIYNSVPQILYFHQSLSLVYPWSNINFLRDRNIWFYGIFFPYVIKFFLKRNSIIVVQTGWMKDAFFNRFKIAKEQIHVFKPVFELVKTGRILKEIDNKCIFFYPAGYCDYKNHMEIVNAIKYIKENSPIQFEKIIVFFTIDEKTKLFKEVQRLGLQDSFRFLGNIPYDKVCQIYQNTSALLFPSLIESFGLPLLEAANFSLKIITIESSYSREVLNGYQGAVYIASGDTPIWANEIVKVVDDKLTKVSFIVNNFDTSWKDFFKLVDAEIL
jgi:glycosyltransferase involved in cell wall biosynthesis